MKPYGNEHKYHGEGKYPTNSSREGKVGSKHRTETRRLARKARRAQDKRTLRMTEY